jgi:UDP-N-acetylmuramoyl-tripeptide--D-alanyl-D-alanine ligase
MLSCKTSEIALWTKGTVHGADVDVHGVFTDTRAPRTGGLFVALAGEHFDAHEFLAQAKAGGAAAALVARAQPIDLPQVVVADTQIALGDLASAIRAQRRAHVIGITGSNGKTTVKSLTASILAQHGVTHVNPGNLNNEIGLPLALLDLPENAEFAVFEMGAGKPGDIAYLAGIARPEVGLVNNVAPAHLERMISLAGVAQTKGAIYSALPRHGVAIINVDDAFAKEFAETAAPRKIIRFGLDHPADVRAEIHALAAQSHFTLITPAGSIDIVLPLAGRHNVLNALAASSIATALEVPLAQIARGLQTVQPIAGRAVRHAMRGGWTLIDDSYNANPGSVAAAIAMLTQESGPAWLALGDMRELGGDAERLHAGIGEIAHKSGIARLFTIGPLAREAAEAFGGGANDYPDHATLAAAIRADAHAGVRVLVKGSRSSRMERVVQALLEGNNGNGKTSTEGARHVA